MTLTLRTRTATGASTKGERLTSQELDDNFLHVIDSANGTFTPSGSGAIPGTVAAALGLFVHTSQYTTTPNFNTASDALTGTIGLPSLRFSGAAWTLVNDITATRAAGTVATGNVDLWKFASTFTGHSGGGSQVYASKAIAEHTGGNAINTVGSGRFLAQQNGTGVITTLQSVIGEIQITNTGNVDGALCFTAAFTANGGGDVTTSVQHFRVAAPSISGGSTVLAIYGMQIGNMGHADITHVNGIYIDDQSGSSGNQIGINLNVSAGANKYNIAAAGTAVNWLQGPTGIGTGPDSSTALNLPAGSTSAASLRVAHGAAPTSPVNGDIWTTTAGLFVRINGATVGPLS